MTPQALDSLSEDEIDQLGDAGVLSDDDLDYLVRTRISPEEMAVLEAIAYGIAKLFHTPINQLVAEAAAHRGPYNKVPGGEAQGTLGLQGERAMIGADGQSYPEIAARAVQSIAAQNPSPMYGYFRTGSQQKIYLFPTLDDARGWLTVLVHGQQPHDYAAVFASVDLTRPVSGLESFGHANVSGDVSVGQLWPFFLGMPFGALGGYFLRKWQEENPGKLFPGLPSAASTASTSSPGSQGAAGMTRGAMPKTAGDYGIGGPWLDIEPVVGGPWDGDDGDDDEDQPYTVGGPWLDIEPLVGGPWVDVVGAQMDDRARRRSWPQTRALIQSAINEVVNATSQAPAAAYVWSLDPPTFVPASNVVLEGTTGVVPFASHSEALDYMRQRIGTPHVALALFDRQSPHWPNPVNWTKSNDPEHASIIAAQAAKASPAGTRAAGDWSTSIGAALDDVRARAQALAAKRSGNVIGVIHTAKDGLWHAIGFSSTDDADDWLGTATQDPAAYTYAAYYDKSDYSWPHPVNEKIGGARTAPRPGDSIRRGIATSGDGWAA